MTATDTELLGEYQQAWRDLEGILREWALAFKSDFQGTLSQVLDFLRQNRVMSKPEWVEMVRLQGTRDDILHGGAELKREMVYEIVSLTAEWKKRLQAFLEAQKGKAKITLFWRRVRKALKKIKDMKILFLGAVGIAVIALCIVGVVLRIYVLSGALLYDTGISFFNLLIDIAVGVFTIWGLFWAASEFARAQVEPDLHLIIGKEATDEIGIQPLTGEADALIGWEENVSGDDKPVSRVPVGLFLENHQPKAARYVRIELWVRDVPHPEEFIRKKEFFKFDVKEFAIQGKAVVLQFGEDLVVYGGTGVYLGKILIDWSKDTHPESITFVAKLHNLEGSKPKEVIVSCPIHWVGEAADRVRKEQEWKEKLGSRGRIRGVPAYDGVKPLRADRPFFRRPRGEGEEEK